ncbi:hypothetical protein E4U42_005964 [Claviceps africana]|uniref:Actin cortical patch SUR7/pH-response regulator PalI n=1 Tax=Claviceps africana TaxID=83212 RepID=A0A8K0NG10_9HYPO|nr:hypothetical protein E4U42_005964 [Claviceps africana]
MKLAPRQLVILLPIVLTLVTFILSMLALYAGHEKGFMEDYAIVRLDTSKIGHNILGASSEKNKKDGEKKNARDLLGDFKNWVGDKKDDAKDKINEVTGKIADKVVKGLGIKDWYSLHVMNSCEGYWSPNSTVPDAGLNITNCSSSSPDDRFNLSKILDKEIKAGPIDLNLARMRLDTVQEKLDKLSRAILSLFVIYAIGAGLSGLAFLCSIVAFWKPDLGRIVLVNFVVSAPGFLTLFIASMIVTVAANTGVTAINKVGGIIGLSAAKGTKFYTLTWVSTGFMGFIALFWLVQFCAVRKSTKRRGFSEK